MSADTDKKIKLIVIAGPTAAGKTDAAIRIAEKINGEIVSADSMQVYKYMDIGTSKPSAAERARVTHHMLDVVTPGEGYSVARYQSEARARVADIAARGAVPIMVGGSGFYINAVIFDVIFDDTDADPNYRAELAETARRMGNDYLHSLLREIDPASHEKIHPNNTVKVARALEFYRETGRRISEANAEPGNSAPFYDAEIFILNTERDLLYDRIAERTDRMFGSGLVDEVRSLLGRGYGSGLFAMRGLGYKEVAAYLERDGEESLDETIDAVKRATKNYAKRQLTWFRNRLTGEWVDAAADAAGFIMSKLTGDA